MVTRMAAVSGMMLEFAIGFLVGWGTHIYSSRRKRETP
jgi:hypothetical protein